MDKLYYRVMRTLWLVRAKNADNEAKSWFRDRTFFSEYKFNVSHKRTCFGKHPNEWIGIWRNVEQKCREKAKEFDKTDKKVRKI